MTRTNDIDRFAEQAGFPARRAFSDLSDLYPRLERFFHMAQAAEREACAKVCEQEVCACCWEDDAQAAAEHLAERIRARGQA